MALVSAGVSLGDVENINTRCPGRSQGGPLADRYAAAPGVRPSSGTLEPDMDVVLERIERGGMRVRGRLLVVVAAIGLAVSGCSSATSSEPPKPSDTSSTTAKPPVKAAVLSVTPDKD